jgi:hypothetical protein
VNERRRYRSALGVERSRHRSSRHAGSGRRWRCRTSACTVTLRVRWRSSSGPLARRHDAPGPEPAGVHAAAVRGNSLAARRRRSATLRRVSANGQGATVWPTGFCSRFWPARCVRSKVKRAPELCRNSLALLQRMHKQWPFFRALLSNLDMVLAKTNRDIPSPLQTVGDEPLAHQVDVQAVRQCHRSHRIAAFAGCDVAFPTHSGPSSPRVRRSASRRAVELGLKQLGGGSRPSADRPQLALAAETPFVIKT